MEANELRIGNLYQPTDSSANFKEVTVDDLKAWSMGAVYGKPIPLTEEWLQVLGFKPVAEKYIVQSFEREMIKVRIAVHRNYFKAFVCQLQGSEAQQHHAFLSDISYIHQLQNLYFVLTGKELELKEAVKA